MHDAISREALEYHRLPRPGKLTIEPTKRMATQHDLALAYSPGIAAASLMTTAGAGWRRSVQDGARHRPKFRARTGPSKPAFQAQAFLD